MPKLIDADKLKEHYAWWDNEDKKIFDTIIDLQPEAVVRCKDCIHKPTGTGVNHDIEFPDEVCPCQCVGDYWYSWMPRDNFFCAWGERREDGDNH